MGRCFHFLQIYQIKKSCILIFLIKCDILNVLDIFQLDNKKNMQCLCLFASSFPLMWENKVETASSKRTQGPGVKALTRWLLSRAIDKPRDRLLANCSGVSPRALPRAWTCFLSGWHPASEVDRTKFSQEGAYPILLTTARAPILNNNVVSQIFLAIQEIKL